MRLWMIAMTLGIVLVCYFPLLPPLSITYVAIPLLALLLYPNNAFRILILVLLGMCWGVQHGHGVLRSQLPQQLEGVDLWIEGTVTGLPELSVQRGKPVQRFDIAIEAAVCPHKQPTLSCYQGINKLRLKWFGHTSIVPGQRWRLLVRVKRPHGMANPGGFDYQSWLLQQGIGGVGYIREHTDNQRLDDRGLFNKHWFVGYGFIGYGSIDRWRWNIAAYLDTKLATLKHLPILKALLIGDKRSISRAQWELFARTGTIHLMVISGLHVGLICMLAYGVVRAICLCLFPHLAAERCAAIAAIIVASAYSAAAGFTLPTQRALMMIVVWMAAIYYRRNIAPSQGLVVALWFCLLFDPWAPIGLSFWLSFAAVAVIFYGTVGRKPGASVANKSWLSQYLVFIGLMPVLAILLGRVSLISPLANVVAVPVFSLLIVPANLVAAILSAFSAEGSLLLWQLLDWLLHVIILTLSTLDQYTRGSMLPIPQLPLAAKMLALTGVLLLLLPRGTPLRAVGLILLLPMVLIKPQAPAWGDLRLTVLDVGQGLSIVVQTQQHSLVYDVGPAYSDDFDTASAVLIPYLQAMGISRIDKLVLSHGDNDHAGGWRKLIEQIPVAAVSYGEQLPGFGEHYKPCYVGQQWHWDGVIFEFLHPGPTTLAAITRGNNQSCVLKISVGSERFLLTGDIEHAVETQLVHSLGAALKSTVLIAPHHGSATSSSWSFIKQLQPEHVVFSSGYRNQFGHPRGTIMQRYIAINSKLHLTSQEGAILFEVMGGELLTPTHYRREKRRYWL